MYIKITIGQLCWRQKGNTAVIITWQPLENCCVWLSGSTFLLGIWGFSCVAFDLTSHSSKLGCSSVYSWAQLHSTELSSPDVHIPPPLPDNLLEWKNKHTPWNSTKTFYFHTSYIYMHREQTKSATVSTRQSANTVFVSLGFNPVVFVIIFW